MYLRVPSRRWAHPPADGLLNQHQEPPGPTCGSPITDFPDGPYRAEDYMDGDGVDDKPVLLSLTLNVERDE